MPDSVAREHYSNFRYRTPGPATILRDLPALTKTARLSAGRLSSSCSARLLSRRGSRCRGRRGCRRRSWRGSRGRRRSWLGRRSGRCRRRSRRAGRRWLSRCRGMLAAASAKDIIRNNGQDNDNKGDQPPAAATTATRWGRRARRGEGVVRVRHETCPPWMKVIKITAINALSPQRVSRERTESAEKPAFSGPPSRQTTQLTAVTLYPALRKSSTSPSGPGRCMAPTAMKTLPLAKIGPACAAITLLRLVIMVCSKAA